MYLRLLLVAAALTISSCAAAKTTLQGDLPIGADLEFELEMSSQGEQQRLTIAAVETGSAAEKSGLTSGDVVVSVNGQKAAAPRLRALLRRVDGEVPLALNVRRENSPKLIRFTPPAHPPKTVDGFDIELGVVNTSDGSRLRTLVAVPTGTRKKRPAIFFTQWVSCDSIVRHLGSRGDQVLAPIGRQLKLVILMVERASDGDSEGPDCDQLDYNTELAHYRQAFDVLASHPNVDPGKIVIVGSSLGSTTAPLLARSIQSDGGKVAGVAVQGGGALTYFERMLNFDRMYLQRRPQVAGKDIHAEMLRRILFHTEYLIKQRSPNAIAQDSSEMAQVRADIRGMGQNEHYGRPFAYHQQAAQQNFLGAWIELNLPVLVMFTEFDQFETEHGHQIIAEMVNRDQPGTASFHKLAGLGHSNWRFNSAIEAYADETGKYDPKPLRDTLAKWLADVIQYESGRSDIE